MNHRHYAYGFVLLVVLTGLTVVAQAAELSVDSLTVDAGASIVIPIHIRGVADLSSVNLTLEYDPEFIQIEMVKKGAVVDNFLIAHHIPQPGELRVALASARGVEANGVLLEIHAHVVEEALGGQQSVLHLQDTRINGSEIPTVTSDGILTIRGNVAVKRRGRYRLMWAQIRRTSGR